MVHVHSLKIYVAKYVSLTFKYYSAPCRVSIPCRPFSCISEEHGKEIPKSSSCRAGTVKESSNTPMDKLNTGGWWNGRLSFMPEVIHCRCISQVCLCFTLQVCSYMYVRGMLVRAIKKYMQVSSAHSMNGAVSISGEERRRDNTFSRL